MAFWATAAGSGLCAALAAAAGKLATGEAAQVDRLAPTVPLTWWVRVLLLAAHFGANGLMWVLFTRALASAPSSLEPTAINTAVNLAASGILGALVFGETLGGGWWVGASLVAVGIVLVQSQSQPQPQPETPPGAKKAS
jgi:drug/metabolite transporter (DMT)-like permease